MGWEDGGGVQNPVERRRGALLALDSSESRDPSTQQRAPGAREDGENGGYCEGGATNRVVLWYGGCAQEQLTGQNLRGPYQAQSECET